MLMLGKVGLSFMHSLQLMLLEPPKAYVRRGHPFRYGRS